MQVLAESDAAFFVVSADPPITEVEIEFLRRVKSKAAHIFIVFNKKDYLRADEQRSAVGFLQKVLAERGLIEADDNIFFISARDALAAKQKGGDAALEASGVLSLEHHIVRALASRKRRWLEDAVRGNAAEMLLQASTELKLRTRALEMPIEELAAKADAFRDALRAIEEQRRITRDLLAGDHRRLGEALDARVGKLRTEIAPKLVGVIVASFGAAGLALEDGVRTALSVAIRDEFDAGRRLLVDEFATDAGASLGTRQKRVNALIEEVRRTAAKIFDMPLAAGSKRELLVLGEDPYWVTENINTSLIPDPGRLVDWLLPAGPRRRRQQARMIAQADEMVIHSAENLRWAIVRGLDEAFRTATAQFEERLDEAIEVTRGVIKDALARRRDRSFAVKAEFDRLATASALLSGFQDEIDRTERDAAAAVT